MILASPKTLPHLPTLRLCRGDDAGSLVEFAHQSNAPPRASVRFHHLSSYDPHESTAVTIQLVDRFAPQDPRLGDATAIANAGADDIDLSLAKLYAEDADWNALVDALSTAKIDGRFGVPRNSRALSGS